MEGQLHSQATAVVRNLFLSLLGRRLREVIKSDCTFSIVMGQELLIECPDEGTVDLMLEASAELGTAALRLGLAKEIKIAAGKVSYSFPAAIVLQLKELKMSSTMISDLIVIPDRELREECEDHPRSACIIRMSDHKGVYCNELILETSRLSANDWVGENMAKYWPMDELNRFTRALHEHKQTGVNLFPYKAYLADGTPCEFAADARLVIYRGQLCRLVKNRDCRSL